MHEIGVVKQVVRTVEDFAKENGVDRIEEIYPIATKGTILDGAKLIMNVVPGLAECDECDEIFNVIEHEGYCPNCGSFEKTVLSGRDFSIRELHLPEPQE